MYLETVPAHARADLLHAFLDRATSLLTDDGVLAWITSDRWLFTQNAADLRAIVGQRFGVESLRRITESAFYVPKTRKAGAPPRVHPVAVVLSRSARATRPLTREAIYPESGEALLGAVPLGSVAQIRLCPWLGRAGVFVLPTVVSTDFPSDARVPCVLACLVLTPMTSEPMMCCAHRNGSHSAPRGVSPRTIASGLTWNERPPLSLRVHVESRAGCLPSPGGRCHSHRTHSSFRGSRADSGRCACQPACSASTTI